MSLLNKPEQKREVVWRACTECGSRYQASAHGYRVNWCSVSCEHAALRRQRSQIENSWIRASWFLR